MPLPLGPPTNPICAPHSLPLPSPLPSQKTHPSQASVPAQPAPTTQLLGVHMAAETENERDSETGLSRASRPPSLPSGHSPVWLGKHLLGLFSFHPMC